jgi:hypothetical protein
MQTGTIQRPQPRPRDRPRNIVLGVDGTDPNRYGRKRRGRKNSNWIAAVFVVAAITVLVFFLVTFL